MAWTAALFDELEALYPDTPAVGASALEVAACNGMIAGAHIMLSGLTPGLPVAVAVRGPHTAFKLFELIAVPVEVNTGAKQRSAYLKNDVNASVIRRAPFYVYDALKPMYNLLMPAGVSAAIAFKTPVEYCRAPGSDRWEIDVTHDGHTITLTLWVERFPCAVPKAGADTFQYVNWISYRNIAQYHNLVMGTPAYDAMLEKYLRAAVYSRQNILPVPLDMYFSVRDGAVALDEAGLDHLIQIARRAGLSLFEGSAFCGRVSGVADNDAFFDSLDHDAIQNPDEIAEAFKLAAFDRFDNDPNALVSLTREPVPGEGERTLRAMAEMLFSYLSSRGLLPVWTQCCLDEPNDALAPAYRTITSIVHACMPGVPILEPVLPTHAIEGCVDIWCPSVDVYENDRAFYDARVAQGDSLYVYTCLTPGGKYLNRMLDMQHLRQVYMGWAPAKYRNIKGYLHWGLNQYLTGDNPFGRSCRMFSERVLEFHPKRAMFLPAGDFCIFYPGENMPLISVRSEAHRIGLEDLTLLERLSEDEADAIVASVFRGFAEYELDITAYRAARRRLLLSACREARA